MIYLYQLLLFFLTLVSLPFLTIWIYFKKGAKEGLNERLTLYTPVLKKKLKDRKYQLWVHAASVGEVKLLQKIPGIPKKNTIVTCTSVAGRNIAKKIFPDITAVLMPIDILIFLKRFVRLIKPSKVLIMETELWPGFIYSVKDIPVILINARFSQKNYPQYYLLRNWFKKLLKWINIIYVRDKESFIRYKGIGVEEKKLKIAGNLKYNFEIPNIDDSDIRFKRPKHPVIVCGSTHKGEEEILIGVYRKLKKEFENLSIIISPRHLERLGKIREILNKNELEFTLWSKKKDTIKPGEIIMVDTIGELAKIYSLSTIAFVGGSLVLVGGHNIIEAAIWKIPVVVGQHFYNFKAIVELFKECGGLKVTKNSKDLYNKFKELLISPDLREYMGEKNFAAALEKKKEIENTLKDIEDILRC